MIRLEPRAQPSRVLSVLSPVIAIALTVVFGAAMLTAMGFDPRQVLQVYFLSPFADAYSRSELLVKAIPLALMGGGLAICFRTNVWNIGAAGQYTLGAIFAGGVALHAPADAGGAWLVVFLLFGMLGGALWAAIPAILKIRFGTNEILVSLMLTYVAALLLDWLVRGPWRNPEGFGFPESRDFAEAFVLPRLVEGTRLHAGLFIAVISAVALWVMMGRTIKGFELRVLGTAPRAGAFAGFSGAWAVLFVMLLSGALAGLAGAIEVSATVGQLQPMISAEYGFVAIIVAFVGRLDPLGALVAALVLAVSYIGGENAQIFLKLPRNVTGIFQGMLLFLLLASDTLIRYRIQIGRIA